MKKTCKRVLAVVLSLVMVFSVISVGAVAIACYAIANTVTIGSDGSTVINANSVEEAIEYMEANPEMFYTEPSVQAKASAQPKATAKATTQKDAKIYPTVIIPGISQSISYLADENGDPVVNSEGEELSGGLLILDSTQILPVVLNELAEPLATALITQSDANGKLAEGVYNTVTQLFSIQASDKNGNPVNNLQTISYVDENGVPTSVAAMSQDDRDYFYRMIPMTRIKDDVGEDNLYLYAFPLIGDPMESAKGLDEYIQGIKEDKGVDKVNVVTISLGGTILTAYLELYKNTGYPDINRVVNVVACLQGTDVMGDFYLRNWNLEDEFFFHEYIPMIMSETSGSPALGYLINIALKIFPKEVVYTLLTAAVDGILDSLMLNCPQFWAMIPEDRFDDAKEKYSYIWEDPEYAKLAKKINRFHKAASNLVDNFDVLMDNDVLVHSVAGYGLDYSAQDYCFFAAMKSSLTTNSDAIIDIDSTTLGATYAPAGEILPDDVLFSEDAIISPDGSVDVSTCAFPENVWLFEGQHHEVGRNDVVISLIGKLITGEIKSVNDMSDKYPQFNGNRNTKNLTRWYLEEAEEVLNAEDQSMYAPEDIVELQAAYDEANALLENTICDATEAEAVTDRLLNALRRVGQEGEAEDTSTIDALAVIAKFVDDTIYQVFGGNGFSDIAQTGPFPG
ncbi:MAG: alpha/beta hydrolase [Clostridia bacterium]|nr:alpha/beta hydrolase [Clostridia bacterium]